MQLFWERIPKRIKELNLLDYWGSLSKNEIDSLDIYGRKYLSCNIYRDLNFGDTQFQALSGFIDMFETMKEYQGCLKTIEYLNRNHIDTNDIVSKHFFYNTVIKLFYRPKTPEICNLTLAKQYCYEDIELVNKNRVKIRKIGDGVEFPRLPAFKILCLILEKEKRYKEAISICDLAIKYNLNDGTKEGFTARRDKLLKKLEKQP